MKEDFKNFIKRAKDIKLSEGEKAILRSKISEFIAFTPIRGKMPVIKEKNYLSVFEVRNFIKAVSLVLILAIVVGGSGVSYAASNALPGDALYNIKVNINEGIEDTLAITPEAKATVQSKKVERRLEEAQTLAKEKKLSPLNQKIVVNKIQEHIDELSKQIDILKENGDISAVLETTSNLTPTLEAHLDILKKDQNDEATTTVDTQALVDQVDDSIKEVQDQENAIIATVEDYNSSTTPMMMKVSSDVQTPEATEEEDASSTKIIKEATRKASNQVKKISNQVSDIVEERIDKAKDKITQIKEEQKEDERLALELLKAQEALTAEDNASTSTDEISDTDASSSTTTIDELKNDGDNNSKVENETDSSASEMSILPISPEPTDTFDIDGKIKDAESKIKKAEQLLDENKFQEALILAQEVNKIAGEIETHRKLKILDLTQKTDTDTNTQKANVIDSGVIDSLVD